MKVVEETQKALDALLTASAEQAAMSASATKLDARLSSAMAAKELAKGAAFILQALSSWRTAQPGSQ